MVIQNFAAVLAKVARRQRPLAMESQSSGKAGGFALFHFGQRVYFVAHFSHHKLSATRAATQAATMPATMATSSKN
mgnify:CR=1 FL=1